MMKMRLHIYIAMGVFLALFILGSFVDLELNRALFSKDNGFGLSVAALSMNLGYAVIAFMGGVIIYHAHKLNKVSWQRICFLIGGLTYLGVAIHFDAGEFFGENGWYGVVPEWVGYFIATPIMASATVGGYFVARQANNPRLWILMVVGAFFIGLSLIIGTTVVKNIFHRPRYRLAVYEGYVGFYPWWERCKNYKDIMALSGLSKEEFKSFPSGHTSVCALTMFFVVLYPFVSGKELKYQPVYFYLALIYTLFVAFTRLLVGAHYLTDIAMGGLITLVCLYIYYEIILHKTEIYQAPQVEEVK